MRKIRYLLCTKVNVGTGDSPVWDEQMARVELIYTDSNLELAKREAHCGDYEIYDDGQPEPEAVPTTEERVAELEEALDMILSGVTE